jgi:C4-dicarboxylate-specific signal transduction histidine kinase
VAQPLRRQIVLLNIVILVPVFAVMTWSATKTYEEQIRQIQEEAKAMASTMVVYMERGLDIAAIQTIIEDIPLPRGSVVTITDRQSTVLARSADAEKFVGRRTTADPRAVQDVPEFVQGVGVDGVERVFANAAFAPGPWLVSVGIPTQVAADRVTPIFRRNAAIAGGVTLFTLLLEFLLLRGYARAFDRALDFSKRVAAGDLTPPTPIRMPAREMETIQQSVIEMVSRMRDAREAIAAQVAEERRMREELESLQRQVIRQERLAAIGVLVSGVAHELNNPLQAILGFAELLELRDNIPPEAKRELALIQRESTRASAIIRNLSRFSRQQTTDASAVRLSDVVASVVELRQRKLDEDNIELDVIESANPPVLAVFAELQQVVLNFVINAEQAVMDTPPPRTISIAIAGKDRSAYLEVRDTGPGVPCEHEAKLFQPFFTTKPVGEGTGLGLSVSYGIIRSHGGTIGYRRSPEGGAVFFFQLPVLSEAQSEAQSDAQSEARSDARS